jgi:hypothetical protein
MTNYIVEYKVLRGYNFPLDALVLVRALNEQDAIRQAEAHAFKKHLDATWFCKFRITK